MRLGTSPRKEWRSWDVWCDREGDGTAPLRSVAEYQGEPKKDYTCLVVNYFVVKVRIIQFASWTSGAITAFAASK